MQLAAREAERIGRPKRRYAYAVISRRPVGSAARQEVEVREPSVAHTVSVMQIERWLQARRAVRMNG
jgi:hypothetical protein